MNANNDNLTALQEYIAQKIFLLREYTAACDYDLSMELEYVPQKALKRYTMILAAVKADFDKYLTQQDNHG